MDTSNIILRPSFWYVFIALVIFVLFIYGTHIDSGKTELQVTKQELQASRKEQSIYIKDGELKTKQIKELNETISKQQNKIAGHAETILQKDELILKLNNSISELNNRPVKVVTKVQDKIVNKPAPEPYHEFGTGNGKITIFSTYGGDGSSLSIWIDGVYQGIFDTYLSNRKLECGAIGAFNKIVVKGRHHIIAKDQLNRKWESDYSIAEDECRWIRLR